MFTDILEALLQITWQGVGFIQSSYLHPGWVMSPDILERLLQVTDFMAGLEVLHPTQPPAGSRHVKFE